MRTCMVDGCKKKHEGLGYCKKHYRKYKKYNDPLAGKEIKFHGMYGTPEYQVWNDMIQRCNNSKRASYKYYGGRGIQVCPKWKDSFLAFFKDMGKKPGNKSSIDRINNNGNYEPGNCKWSSPKMQVRNRSNTVLNSELVIKIRKLFDEGHKKIEISKKLDLNYHNIISALIKNSNGSWKYWKLVRGF